MAARTYERGRWLKATTNKEVIKTLACTLSSQDELGSTPTGVILALSLR